MIRLVMAGIVSLSLLVVATAQQKAQENDSQQSNQIERAKKLGGQQSDKVDNGQPTAEQNQRTELPELFKQLDLNEEQTQQLLSIYRDSDQRSQEIWDRVQDLHRQAISMEASAIAAARLEGHDHSAHENQAVPQIKTDTDRKADPVDAAKSAGTVKDAQDLEEKTVKASSPRENAEIRKAGKTLDENTAKARKANRREKRSADESQPSDGDKAAAWSGLDGDLNVVVIRVGIAQPDGRVREYLLTPPSSNDDSDSDPTFNAHSGQLKQVWKDIHDGHEELVELEANTIVKVEAQLTEAQLQKLDAAHSQASTTPKNPDDDSRR